MPLISNAVKNQNINLYYNFYVNGILSHPVDFPKVEFYKINGATSTLVQTLYSSTGEIIESPALSGKFQYVATLLTSSGEYKEIIYITPAVGQSFSQEIYFTVYDTDPLASGYPVTSVVPTCRVYGTILDANGKARQGSMVVANITKLPNLLTSTQYSFTQIPQITLTDSQGMFYLDLPQNIEMYIAIKDISFRRYVQVPAADTALLWTIAAMQEIGDTTNDVSNNQNTW
jgi:hypothetical protein